MRNLFKRHPDLFLHSLGSMQAKVNYVRRELNRNVQNERSFPLLLHYSFTEHIWPRCETLRTYGMKNFDLREALIGSDKQFCEKFDVKMGVLTQKRKAKKPIPEKDILWTYGGATGPSTL